MRKLTGEEKSAILLRAIGEDAAALVMKHLEPKEIRKIGAQMAGICNITREEELEVMGDFHRASSTGEISFEGKEYIKTILTKALGPEKAARIIDTLTSASYPGLEALKWVDPKTSASLIKSEHPQTIAVILAHLDADQASQVLAALPGHLHADVALRLATMEEVQPDVLQHLSDALQETLKANTGPRAMNLGGAQVMAEILTRLDKHTEGGILTKLAERDAGLADNIRALMFVFDDLVKVDDRGIQELLKEASKEELPLALRGASQEVRQKIFRNMSTRAAQMLKEDMDGRGPVKVSEVERAQQNILKLTRKLEEEGRVTILGEGEDLV